MQFAWVIVGFLIGVAVGHFFWTQIKEWAYQVLGPIVDNIDRRVNVLSDGLVTLIKGRAGEFVKRMVVYIRDLKAAVNNNTMRYVEEPISRSQIPPEILAQMDQRAEELKVLQLETRR